MKIECRSVCLAVAFAVLIMAGCKPRNDKTGQTQQAPGPSPAQIAAVRDAMTRGMEEVVSDSLAPGHVGRQCVVTTHRADGGTGADQAPPPLGMVRRLGQTVIYRGEIQEVSPEILKIRAAYPTSGRYKAIEIRRSDVQSVYLAKSSSE